MPLFRLKGRPEDWTYMFDENPNPDRYEPADAPVAKKAKAEPPTEPDQPAADETKES